jgi:hypothetical protein
VSRACSPRSFGSSTELPSSFDPGEIDVARAQDDPEVQSQNLAIREHLNDAYAAVEGQKTVQSFAAFTFEDALDQQIERIEGADTVLRPNKLHRIDKIESNVLSAVAKIRALPPDAFAEPDDARDINSAP